MKTFIAGALFILGVSLAAAPLSPIWLRALGACIVTWALVTQQKAARPVHTINRRDLP